MSIAVQRTMRELRGQGIICEVVQHWNPHGGNRHDLYGILDVQALDKKRGVIGIQCCLSDYMEHYRKFTEGDLVQNCIDWLETPGTVLEIWSWRRLKIKRGGKAVRWTPRIVEITMKDFGGGSE